MRVFFLAQLCRPLSLLLLALCVMPACKAAEAHTYNLRELHEDTGHHKRVASLMTETQYVFHEAFNGLFRGTKAELKSAAPSKVEDPLARCVQNLLALASFKPVDESVAALQVECFARYVAIDPWQISRQICARALGDAGARLKLGEHPPETFTGPVATPEAVRDVLGPLVRAVAPAKDKDAEPRPDLAAACHAMAALNYDLDGLLRALPASAALWRREKGGEDRRALLHDLVVGLERRTVQVALERASADTNPYVLAAVLEAQVHANGAPYLAKLMARIGTEPDPEVQMSLLSMVRALGLPGAKLPGADAAQSEREGELALLYKVATEHPVDRVRVSAMATLGEVSGAGFKSLREEDWQTWWFERTQSTAR